MSRKPSFASLAVLLAVALAPVAAVADKASAHYHQAMAYKRDGKLPEAIRELEAALQERHDYAAARYSIGILYRKRGAYRKAIYHLEEGIKLEPKNGKMHYSLGLAYWALGTKEYKQRALTALQRAAELQPKDPKVLGQVGVLMIRRDPERAIQLLTKVVRMKRSPNHIHQLGLAYRKATTKMTGAANEKRRAQYLKKAEKYLLWALSLKQTANLHFDLGALYRRMENTTKAIRHYEAAVKAKPDFAAAWWDLGHMYTRGKRPDEAIDAYQNYVRLKGTSPDAKIARKRIQDLKKRK